MIVVESFYTGLQKLNEIFGKEVIKNENVHIKFKN